MYNAPLEGITSPPINPNGYASPDINEKLLSSVKSGELIYSCNEILLS